MFSDNAQRFKQIMQEMAPQAGLNLLPVTDIGPDTAILLKEAGSRRVDCHRRRSYCSQPATRRRMARLLEPLYGASGPFPQGPFILASILRCPVDLIFALRQQGKLRIHCEPFADPLLLPRADRQNALQQAIDRYAERLEHYALQSPLDWFNFSISGSCRIPKTRSKGA